jgi:cobaltochelatase CobT
MAKPNFLNVEVTRQAITAITRILASQNVKVTQQGSRAYVNCDNDGRPKVVNLPYLPDNATDELIAAIHGFLDHEIGHILFSDFATLEKAKRKGKGTKDLTNTLEDVLVEREMQKKYLGSGFNLDRVREFFVRRFTQPQFEEALSKGDANALLGVLFVPAIRALAGQDAFKEFMKDKWDIFKPIMNKLGPLLDEVNDLKTTADSFDLAQRIMKALELDDQPEENDDKGDKSQSQSNKGGQQNGNKSKSSKSDKQKQDGAQGQSSNSDQNDGEESDEAQNGSGGKDEKGEESDEQQQSKGRGPKGDNEGDDDEEEGAGAQGADGQTSDDGQDGDASNSDQTGKTQDGDGVINESRPSGQNKVGPQNAAISGKQLQFDPESIKDFDEALNEAMSELASSLTSATDYRVFTKDYDQIDTFKYNPSYFSPELVTQLEDGTRTLVGPIQKSLERLIAARSQKRNLPGRRSGKINSGALFRLKTGDDRVFKGQEITKTKNSVGSIVIDLSGSMGGSKIKTAIYSAFAISSALSRFNIPHEISGFTTRGNTKLYNASQLDYQKTKIRYSRLDALDLPIFKSFGERLGIEQKRRLAMMAVGHYEMNSNVDGESVLMAASRLKKRPEPGKFMIVLSDGRPACSGGTTELYAHLKQATREIESAGIKLVGIGIKSEAVREFYRNYAIVNDIEELPRILMKEIQRFIL